MRGITLLSTAFFLVFFTPGARSQGLSLKISPEKISLNQALRVEITSKAGRVRSYTPFPDIQGFRKGGVSSSSTTNIVNGRMSSLHSIVQSYYPLRAGSYVIPPFQITVDGKKLRSRETSVQVLKRQAVQQQKPFFPFAHPFFGDEPKEYISVKDDAFFGMYTDKNEVYVGEGVTLSLSFYVAERNEAVLQFYDISNQIAEISQKIKPASCWEERHPIDNIEKSPVTIGGKRYTRYLLYRSTFFSLNTDTLRFSSLPLKVLKYRVARNPSFFGRNRQEDYKTFYSPKREVLVRPLPPHPLRDSVAVGRYTMREELQTQKVETGDGFVYSFTVTGEGNIRSLQEPSLLSEDGTFEVYPPNITQQVNRARGLVYGQKSFAYQIIPQEAGEYRLGDYFEWVYFDPDKEAYLTLRPRAHISVFGESLRNQAIRVTGQNIFYNYIASQKNEVTARQDGMLPRIGGGVCLALIAFLGVWFSLRTR